jgi:hypothetical protein
MDKVDKLISTNSKYISELYRDIETRVIYEIAEMIRERGYITETGKYELSQLDKIYTLDSNVLKELSRISGKPMGEIMSMMKDIAISSIDVGLFKGAYEAKLIESSIDSLDSLSSLVPMQKSLTRNIRLLQSTATHGAIDRR